ncbi:MAG: hypothetical protein IVW52_12700 [Acidimicrobiales bacterium]|nr:hypothetical protein [Acidimicrobiales bacterium]
MAAAVLIVIAASAWVKTSFGDRSSKSASAPKVQVPPRAWQLAADLSGSQFVLATGNPAAVLGVTCGDTTTCFLSTGYGLDYSGGGGMFVSHDGGRTWQPTTLPPDTAITTLVSCATSTWCASGSGRLDPTTGDPAAKKPSRDPELMVTTDGGATWASKPVPIPVDVQQLPAYQNLPAETTYWPGQIDAVSCSAPGICNVVGHTQVDAPGGGIADELVFLRTTDGGTHWSSSILPELSSEASFQVVVQSGDSVSMACPTANACIVVGSLFPVFNLAGGVVDVWRTTDAGKDWEENRVQNVNNIRSGVTCPDTVNCWMIPQAIADPASGKYSAANDLLHSSDGGTKWTPVAAPNFDPPRIPPGGGTWSSISCASQSVCYLGGSGIAETTNEGSSWQKVSLPSQVGGVLGISCNHERSCVALATPVTQSGNFANEGSLILTNSATASPGQD